MARLSGLHALVMQLLAAGPARTIGTCSTAKKLLTLSFSASTSLVAAKQGLHFAQSAAAARCPAAAAFCASALAAAAVAAAAAAAGLLTADGRCLPGHRGGQVECWLPSG